LAVSVTVSGWQAILIKAEIAGRYRLQVSQVSDYPESGEAVLTLRINEEARESVHAKVALVPADRTRFR
jgi:hypothetical protein